jgi:hypothetical protein
LAALAAALLAWLYLGAETKAVVFRAIISTAIAGLLLGSWPLSLKVGGRWKSALFSGAIKGLLLHPATWLVFVLWTRWAVLLDGGAPAGNLWDDLYSALIWSLGSVMYGFVVTVPAMAAAAYLSTE